MERSEKHFNCSTCSTIDCKLKLLTTREINQLKRHSISINIDKGEMLFKQDAPLNHILYLKNGLVKVYNKYASNKTSILQIKKSGDFLGIRYYLGNGRFQYSSAALIDSEICFITPALFNKFLKNNALFCYEVLTSISEESLFLNHQIQASIESKLYGRVAKALLHFSEDIFKSDTFTLPLSITEFSQYVGGSRERVSRVISELKNNNVIEDIGTAIHITQKKKLLLFYE